MSNQKDYTKRIIKELVDYYIYHDLHQFNIAVDYAEDEKVTITIVANYTYLPSDLEQLTKGLSAEKHPEWDTLYSALLGSHSRDKNYMSIGRAIDDFTITTDNNELAITLKWYNN